ncbi:hypothetical protein [Microbulbifer spongiae]|uniref:Uncharacterized protein n=1 Tax=Microbulbifer spongiae TaxID=2944933 RepID=A0ABY9E9X2_9GAMM|nr:hypothetical protein [Microbulbifer sp. MI-G]WKD48214.1 hypothetical protein M8T91_09705 [Microbulbifer sp. MI-G]
MEITQSIETMLEEIRNYSGNFGDPIVDCIDFNPIEVLASGDTSYTIGAGIALLVKFASHIDNATYQDALSGGSAKAIQQAINNNYCVQQPVLFNALTSALVSGKTFNQALNKVYSEYVQ